MSNHLIHFGWAMKRLLRNKSNYVVLEGFLSTLLGEDIRICRFLISTAVISQCTGLSKEEIAQL